MSNVPFFKAFEAYLNGEDRAIAKQVNADQKGNANTRMNIYRDAYVYRLVDILVNDFSAVYQILGTEAFIDMGKTYLQHYPSTTFTVRHFGQHLPKFLHETPPYKDYPYLWQVADFEWEKGSVFDAQDSDIFTLEQLATLPAEAWNAATFTFIPALTRLVYDYNVPQIWQAIENESQDSEPTELSEPLAWVMWRKDFSPNWYSMAPDEDWFLRNARQGKDFPTLCEGLAQWIDDDNEIAQRAATIVRRWIDEQMLATVNYSISDESDLRR